jgi:hypothetical protein
VHGRLEGNAPFLWMDESRERSVRVRRAVLEDSTQSVPNGMIHHLDRRRLHSQRHARESHSVVQDYDSYHQTYRPVVVDSKGLGCTATDREFFMVWQRRGALRQHRHEGSISGSRCLLGERRGYDITETTRVEEIEDYGRDRERLMPPRG